MCDGFLQIKFAISLLDSLAGGYKICDKNYGGVGLYESILWQAAPRVPPHVKKNIETEKTKMFIPSTTLSTQ